MRITDRFVLFFSANDIFSQWYPAPFTVKGKRFLTAEHYMMYCKACFFGDRKTALKILQCKHPKEAKSLGRNVAPFDAVEWDKKAPSFVHQANLEKFRQNPELRIKLVELSDKEFVEASPYDKIWGVGLLENDDRILDPVNWKGRNLLGRILTITAKEIANEIGER